MRSIPRLAFVRVACLVVVCVVVVRHAAGCSADGRTSATRTREADAARDLAVLATGQDVPREAPAFWEPAPDVAKQIDDVLQHPGFAASVAPRIVLGEQIKTSPYTPGADWVLKRSDDDVLYLRARCEKEQAERVNPWWALSATVLVCPDSHQPTRLRDDQGRFCGAEQLDPAQSSFCGCGPNLALCYRDARQVDAVLDSMRDEVTQTIADVVQRDEPMSALFLANETVRDGNAELLYVRSRIINGELSTVPAELESWPRAGVRARRSEAMPGQHAGILTTPHMLYFRDNPRDRMQTAFQKLWCTPPPHNGSVTADIVLALGTGNVRVGQGADREHAWKDLAARPVCTECHARMDYGAQFFAGYPEVRVAPFFVRAAAAEGSGPVYGTNIDDLRGSAPLSPHGFAALATSEADFESCMVNNVATYVFADRAEPDDVRAIRASYRERGTLRSMMRTALMRYAARASVPPQPSSTTPDSAADLKAAAPGPDAAVAISATLRPQLSQFCIKCHDEAPRDFRPTTLPRETVVAMLNAVAFGSMPKKRGAMSTGARALLTSDLIDALWPAGPGREEARTTFLHKLRALPALGLPALLSGVRGGTQRDMGPSAYLLAVPPDQLQLSPGTAALAAVEAVQSCRADARPDACVRDRLATRRLTYGRP